MMVQLLGFPTQNTKKVIYVLEELGVDYQFKKVNLRAGEQKSPEILKLNPFGKVPILVHNGESLFESGAICRYLANVENSPLYPQDKLLRAKVDQWMDWFSCHLGRWLSGIYFQKFLKDKPNPAKIEESLKFATPQFAVVDHWLSQNAFLTGKDLTLADLFAYAYVEQVGACEISIKDFPHLQNWLNKISQRESVLRSLKKLEEWEKI